VPKRSKTLFDIEAEKEPTSIPPLTKAVPETAAASTAWLDSLFASTSYRYQKELVRRHAPEDSLVSRCLMALDASGGIMTPAAFSNATNIPAARLDGLMAHIQRLLNVDGYEILTFSRAENRIELNVPKLKRQFDLD
jgi:hypothetical protein